MEPGLLPLLNWCVEALAPEAEAAGRWADCYLAVPDRARRARRMLGELSERIVASGSPRDFANELPGVREGLPLEAAYLVFRMVKTNLYVAAAHGVSLVDPAALEDQNLLLLGAELGLPTFTATLTGKGPAGDLLRRHFPRARGEASALVQAELVRRVTCLEGQAYAGALRGTLEFLTVASAADFANAYYDDMLLSLPELVDLNRAAARRAVAVMGLVKLVARADDALAAEEEALLSALRNLVPEQDPSVRQEAMATMSAARLPEVLTMAEERQGLLACMVAMAGADGVLSPEEEQLCRDAAGLLEISNVDIERALSNWRGLRM